MKQTRIYSHFLTACGRFTLAAALAAIAMNQALPAAAASYRLSSKTQKVTAYQGMALITRRVEVPALTVGAHELVIDGLPAGLNADSLSVSGEGTARLKIHHLQLRPPADGGEDPALAALRKQVEALQLQLAKVENLGELSEFRAELLQTFQEQLAARAANPQRNTSVKEWDELMKFALSESETILDSRLSTEARVKALQEQLALLTQRLAEAQQASGPRMQATLYVSAETPGSTSLQLSYLIGNVGWSPAYEARLDSAQKQLRLVWLGDLGQRSGESWDDVQLTLSTVTPVLNQRPPVATAWQVGPRPMPLDAATGQISNRRFDNEGRDMPAAGPTAQEVNYAQSEIQNTGISVRFQLPEAQDVPSSTQTRRVAMASRELACSASYRIVPRQSPLAFLEVQLKNESGLPMLPGPLRSYLGEEFTGSQPIELIRPGQSTRLNFGVDQDIKVSWKESERKQRETGMLGDMREWTVSYEAEVTNFKPIPVELRIQEPAPQVQDAAIKIEQILADPAPTNVSSDKKLQTWSIKAQPWEKKTITLSYRITAPKGMELYF